MQIFNLKLFMLKINFRYCGNTSLKPRFDLRKCVLSKYVNTLHFREGFYLLNEPLPHEPFHHVGFFTQNSFSFVLLSSNKTHVQAVDIYLH